MSRISSALLTTLLVLLLPIALLLPSFLSGLYGFDWTDMTYHFQEALDLVHGRVPGRDMIAHLPGFSFFLEAGLLRLLGPDFLSHQILGWLFPLLCAPSIAYIAYRVAGRLPHLARLGWAGLIAATIGASFWGGQLYFNFSSLAVALSPCLAVLLHALLTERGRLGRTLLLIGLTGAVLGLQLLTKQSHGLVNLLLVVIALPVFLHLSEGRRVRPVLVPVGLALSALATAWIVSLIYCEGCMRSHFLEAGGSLELKGLSLKDPLKILGTIVGFFGYEAVIFLVLVPLPVLLAVMALFRMRHASAGLALILPLLPILLYLRPGTLYLLHYLSVAFVEVQLLLLIMIGAGAWRVPEGPARRRNFAMLCVISLPLVGSAMAEQLSWPGRHDVHAELTMSLLVMQALSFLVLFGRMRPVPRPAAVPLLLALLVGLVIVHQAPRRFEPASAGLVPLDAPPSFAGWRVAPATADAVRDLRALSAECGGTGLFQMAWMPIAYELTGRSNPTGYDLPYHDTITEADAGIILRRLSDTPPDLLVVQPDYRDYRRPFPALGMKRVYEGLDARILPRYDLVGEISDAHNEFRVYCRKR